MTYTQNNVKSALSFDFNAAKVFFDLLGKTEICFRLLPDKDKSTLKPFSLTGSFEQHCNTLSKKNQQGYGIFAVVNDGGHDAKSISKINAVFVDFDEPELPQPDYAIEPSFIVRTSQGKHHAYWVSDEVTTSQFQPLQKELIRQYKTDTSVNNLDRVMRVPGFYHCKGEPQMVTMEINSHQRYVMSDLEKLCSVGLSIPTKATLESDAETQETLESESLDPKVALVSDAEISFNPSLAAYVQKIVKSPDNEINDTVFKVAYEMGIRSIEVNEFERAIATALMMRGREGDQHHLYSASRGYNAGFDFALKKAKKSNREFHLEVIEKTVRGHLKRDEYGMQIYYRGIKINDVSKLYLQLSTETGLTLQKQYTQDKLEILLESPDYQSNSLRDQFLQYADQYNDESIMDEISIRMGVTSEIQKVFLKKFFIRLAARTLYPGCKADECMILKGSQGVGKTEFFVSLLGDRQYYAELNPNESDKDERMKINRVAIGDMNEIENTFTKKDMEVLKAFISTRDDTFRIPYGRSVETFPRHCVLVGTANTSELLRDSTGNRRFQIVEIEQKIDIKWFRENTPKILGYCVNLLKGAVDSGFEPMSTHQPEFALWWLSPDEKIAMTINDKQFEKVDDLEEMVMDATISLGSGFKMTELVSRLSGLELNIKDRTMMSRIKAILEKNQYKKGRRGGVKTDHWYAPEISTESTDEPYTAPTTDEPDQPCIYVPMEQVQIGDTVTEKKGSQVMKIIGIEGDNLKLGSLTDGSPLATRKKSECDDAKRYDLSSF